MWKLWRRDARQSRCAIHWVRQSGASRRCGRGTSLEVSRKALASEVPPSTYSRPKWAYRSMPYILILDVYLTALIPRALKNNILFKQQLYIYIKYYLENFISTLTFCTLQKQPGRTLIVFRTRLKRWLETVSCALSFAWRLPRVAFHLPIQRLAVSFRRPQISLKVPSCFGSPSTVSIMP